MTDPGFDRRVLGTPTTTYAPIVQARGSELLMMSGLFPVDDNGLLAGATMAEQTAVLYDRLEALLTAHGCGLRNVVRVGGYMTDLSDYVEYSRIRGERFGDDLPASTVVQVAGLVLDGALVEIDAIAVR